MSAVLHESDFVDARFMPSLSSKLKTIVTEPFHLGSYTRLGKLQAVVRQRGW